MTGVDAVGGALRTARQRARDAGQDVRFLQAGVSRDDVEKAFAGWALVDEELADTSGMPGPLTSAAPRWYRLRRS